MPENILIFVDSPGQKKFLEAYTFPKGLIAHPTSKLHQVLSSHDILNLTVIVTGHGEHFGITALSPIKPAALLQLVREIGIGGSALIVLGQCYAGVFNFLDARGKHPEANLEHLPEICLLGATGFTVSISATVDLSRYLPPFSAFSCPQQWLANIFLFFFMIAVCIRPDIDGDGSFTVTDAYKFANIHSDNHLLVAKRAAFQKMISTGVSTEIASFTAPPSMSQQLSQKAQEDFIMLTSTVLSTQTPWMLHANFARSLLL
ncbi:MAG: hypothetical protein AAF329_05735 [Cyanobacteria bacterium P01_A01_bin.17]